MLVLELLGTLSLRDEGHPVPVSAQQKRLLRLLALLAVAGKQGIARDRIEAYLWPDSTGENARHSLDQTVYSTRNALGTEILISSGRELKLNADLIQADVWEFEDAIRGGRYAAAAQCYKGPLLDGVHLADSHELEVWINTNRNRLRFEYQATLERLAKLSAEASDHAQSVTWLRRLVTSDPLSATATKKLMLALAAAGDRAAAVKQARLYQELVKQELEIDPDSEIEILAAALSRPPTTEPAELPGHLRAAANQPVVADDPGVTSGTTPATPLVARRTPEAKSGNRQRDRRLPYAVLAFAILASGATVWGSIRNQRSEQIVRYTLVIDSSEALVRAVPFSGRIAIAPDGSRLAYIGGSPEKLLIRPRNELYATAIPGTEMPFTPFFSPDGRSVGFLREKGVWQVSLTAAGPPIHISDSLTGVAGASWGPDGFIYVDGFESAPLVRVEATQGATPTWFTALDTAKGEFDHAWPNVLPNGKGVLFTVSFSGKNSLDGKSSLSIAVAEIPSGKHRIIIKDGAYPVFARAGNLLYVAPDRTLMMVAFDQSSMKVIGEPTAMIKDLRLSPYGGTDLAISSTGTLVYSVGTGVSQYQHELVWAARDGKTQPVDPEWQGMFQEPAISPDGRQLAISKSPDGLTGDIWIRQLDGGATIKLTNDRIFNGGSTWKPGGRSLTFAGIAAKGHWQLWTQPADGSGEPVLLWRENRNVFRPRWSPDAKWLIFGAWSEATGSDIFGVRPGMDTASVRMVGGKFEHAGPEISPDGRWLAYTSDETGRYEIYVVPFPNTTARKWAISSRGGLFPMWSPRGNELFYRDTLGDVFGVGVRTAPTFSFDKPERLFAAKRAEFLFTGYAVTPDGQRFLMIRQLRPMTPDRLIVVENWFEELNAKARRTID